MGFNDAMSGYKKLTNEHGYSTQELFAKLQSTTYSFGTPSMGKVQKDDAILFDEIDGLTVYVKATPKSIEIGRVALKGTGKFILKELGAAFLTNAQSKGTAVADRAVEELYEVIVNMESTGIVENKSSAKTAIKLYMRQKIVAIRDKYDICTEDETSVYWVQGNLISHGYKIEDANGNLLLEIKKKLIALLPEYTMIKDGQEIGTIKKKIRLTKPEITGTINGEEIQIKGDLSGYHFSIKSNDVVIGNVDTERLTWGDVYSIDIKDPEKQDLVVAIAIVVDNVLS